jgi:SNF family Na+-dependent transporter
MDRLLKKILGNDVLIIYLISIIAVTVSFALMIDFVFPKKWFAYTLDSLENESKSILDIGGAIIFLITMFYFVVKNWLKSISLKKLFNN